MAPEMASKTCTNCHHARAVSTFERCRKYFATQTPGNAFPEWEKPQQPASQP